MVVLSAAIVKKDKTLVARGPGLSAFFSEDHSDKLPAILSRSENPRTAEVGVRAWAAKTASPLHSCQLAPASATGQFVEMTRLRIEARTPPKSRRQKGLQPGGWMLRAKRGCLPLHSTKQGLLQSLNPWLGAASPNSNYLGVLGSSTKGEDKEAWSATKTLPHLLQGSHGPRSNKPY